MTQPPWGDPTSRPGPWPPPQGGPSGQPWGAGPQWPQQGWPAQQWTPPAPPHQWPPRAQQQWPPQAQPWPHPAQQWPAPPPRRPRGPSLLSIAFRLALIVAGIVFISSLLNGLMAARQPAPPPPPAGGGTGTPGGTGSSAGSGPYVNERYTPPPPDMNPPAIPGPRDTAAAGRLLESNPLYAQQVPVPTRCDVAQVDGVTASRSQLEGHLNDLMGCLMSVWDAPVADAGFTMPRPPVVVYTRAVKTACGSFDDVNAAYCSGDQRVYYAQALLRSFPPSLRQSPYAVEMILAHEFGHAVQARTAILASEKRLEQRAATEAAAHELSRRTEVQADCFAGLFVRSVAQSQQLGDQELASLGRFTYALGDDVLSGRPGWSEGHGLGSSRQAWFVRGTASSTIGTCNAFTAPGDQVR